MDKPKASILVVDDSMIIRKESQEILESFGYKVDLATGGGEGLRAVIRKKYDLVLLDIEMPKINGFQVFQRIRSRDALKTLPIIIFFTEQMELKVEGLKLGASDFILKSLAKTNTTEFHARIEAHLKIGELIRKQMEIEKRNILQAATTTAFHEIFNPLTAAMTGVDFALKNYDEKEDCQECVAMLKTAREGLDKIEEAVRKISSLETTTLMPYAGGGKMMRLNTEKEP